MIDMEAIAATAGETNEHPLARRVWHILAMQGWRSDWRAAVESQDFSAMDRLDRAFERAHAV